MILSTDPWGTTSRRAPDVLALERRVALRNRGRIDPRSLDEYITRCGGYSGLDRALKLGRDGVLAALRRSGLRGRGGAGYPTAAKWQACHDAEADQKYTVCNAIDADPQARTAKALLGGDPHAVLEGLLIGTFAVGASRCFICVNSDYAAEVAVLEESLDQMRGYGLLGDGILGSGFSCYIEVRGIAPSLVAGEETALIGALEGKQPLPYIRFDYPAVKGLYGAATLVNSAETLANVSAIFQGLSALGRDGAAPPGDAPGNYPGVADNPGAKVVTVCGDVARPRTVEIPFGTTIRALLEATQASPAAEGVPANEPDMKAVQFGGPTGAFFAGASLDTPITYEDLEAAGSIMGSATLQVFDGARDACAVEIARDAMSYLAEQSCGKCVVCREGTYQLADMLTDVAEARGKADDMELLLELCEAMEAGSICGLGKTAPTPLLSLLRLFPDDFAAHIDDGRCPAASSASGTGKDE
jgi:NADH-quinone oxidoreductase subunit F